MGNLKFILISCLVLIATSCDGLFGVDNNVGKPIQFGVSQHPTTRTSYSSEYGGRIEWGEGDQVSIYMDWDDGSGYTGNPERGVYSVKPGSNFHPGDLRYGRISYANDGEVLKWQGDFSGGDGRAHEYPHTFYSAYPPTNLINGKFTFYLPSEQNGNMNFAYMAAYEEDVKSNTIGDGHVELHYYPMITTFCLTIHNDLDEPIETITLKSDRDSDYLSGNYSVSVNDGMFEFNGYEGNNSIHVTSTVNIDSGETVKNILFFIIPQDFDENELYFLLNSDETKRYTIDKPIEAYFKYNINITVSEREPDIEEPEPLPPLSIDDDAALAQLILSLLVGNGGAPDSWRIFEDYFREYFEYDSFDALEKGLWKDASDGKKTLNDDARNATLENSIEILKELFPGEKLTGLLHFLQTLTDIHIKDGNSPKLNSSELDLSFFKSAQTIYLELSQSNMAINVNGLEALESIELITTGEVDEIELSVTDCPSFKKVKMNGDRPNKKTLNLTGTPKFEEGEISTGSGRLVEITLKDCSTEVENGGVITLSSGDATISVHRKPRKEGEEVNVNVDVVAGYWEYWPEYKYVEKHW